jgi:hypothetical protein
VHYHAPAIQSEQWPITPGCSSLTKHVLNILIHMLVTSGGGEVVVVKGWSISG